MKFICRDARGKYHWVLISPVDASRVLERKWNIAAYKSGDGKVREMVYTNITEDHNQAVFLHRYLLLGITDSDDPRRVKFRDGNHLNCTRENIYIHRNEKAILIYGEEGYWQYCEDRKKRENRGKKRAWKRRRLGKPMKKVLFESRRQAALRRNSGTTPQ